MSEKPKPISVKVRTAIDAMVAGDAKTSPMPPPWPVSAASTCPASYPSLTSPNTCARRSSARWSSGPACGTTKLALLDSPNEMVRDRASSFVLGLIGSGPTRTGRSARATQSGTDHRCGKPRRHSPGHHRARAGAAARARADPNRAEVGSLSAAAWRLRAVAAGIAVNSGQPAGYGGLFSASTSRACSCTRSTERLSF